MLTEHTPAHLKHSMSVHREPTPSMMLGTAVHSLVLEPEKFDTDVVVAPVVDKRTKIGGNCGRLRGP